MLSSKDLNLRASSAGLSSSSAFLPSIGGSHAIPRTILSASPCENELFHRSLLAARLGGETTSAVATSDVGDKSAKRSGSRAVSGGPKSRQGDNCTAYAGNLPYGECYARYNRRD